MNKLGQTGPNGEEPCDTVDSLGQRITVSSAELA